ncbi:MAG: fluoride efflux transporter CrcB [Antricoccus sp.]
MIALWIALAGGAGALCRFVLDGWGRSKRTAILPWPTIVINISGSLLLGVLIGLVPFQHAPAQLQTIIGTGFLGGYTTFSTASFETIRLTQQRRYGLALVTGVGTLVLSVSAGALGLFLGYAL